MSLYFVKTLGPIPNSKKQKHSMLMADLNKQGYREVKLHVILVGAMGTIYKDYTDKPLAGITIRIKNGHTN